MNYGKNVNKLLLFFAALLFSACNNFSEENDYDQTVKNESSFDVYMNGTLVKSGTTATITLSSSIDDDDEYLSLISTDYPRVTVSRNPVSFRRYEYTVSNYCDSFSYYDSTNESDYTAKYYCKQVTIENTSSKTIKVYNPYFYSTYKGESASCVSVESGKSESSSISYKTDEAEKTVTYTDNDSFNLYNDYATFTAVYDDGDSDSSNDIAATIVSVTPIRYTSSETDSSKRKGNGHIIGYKVVVN